MAIVRRFYQGASYAAVRGTPGITEGAARKRVGRGEPRGVSLRTAARTFTTTVPKNDTIRSMLLSELIRRLAVRLLDWDLVLTESQRRTAVVLGELPEYLRRDRLVEWDRDLRAERNDSEVPTQTTASGNCRPSCSTGRSTPMKCRTSTANWQPGSATQD
jgi:hypothetical protein